jgi:hypothetical protein
MYNLRFNTNNFPKIILNDIPKQPSDDIAIRDITIETDVPLGNAQILMVKNNFEEGFYSAKATIDENDKVHPIKLNLDSLSDTSVRYYSPLLDKTKTFSFIDSNIFNNNQFAKTRLSLIELLSAISPTQKANGFLLAMLIRIIEVSSLFETGFAGIDTIAGASAGARIGRQLQGKSPQDVAN